jgi:SAM-dependent methyltransferase
VKFVYDSGRAPGRQYIAEATDLGMIQTGTYDFALSCHSLEHTANPLKALTEWKRILKESGALLLVVPHKEDSFDHRRPLTRLEHLVDDFKKGMGEDDATHMAEVLKYHDIDRDWGSPNWQAFEERTKKNFENRCMHQHVFDTSLVAHMLDFLQMQLLSIEALRPFHIIIAARKLAANEKPKNESLLSAGADWRKASPFRIDRETDRNGKP